MELVLFIGIPATGKSTFYKERFYRTHVRINLDMLRTRRRERLLVAACIAGQTSFVVDNTNVTRAERELYIGQAKLAGFGVTGYFFHSDVSEALRRNRDRPESDRIPPKGLVGRRKELQLPTLAEGFDRLFYVRLEESGTFLVEDWQVE